MKETEIKRSLNKPVRFTNPKLYLEGVTYILTGAVIRLGADGFYYQAELTDPTTENSVIYCGLNEIERSDDP